MKKMMITGVLTAALIAGGTGAYTTYAKDQSTNASVYMQTREVNTVQLSNSVKSGTFEEMKQFMEDGNVNFGQMKPYMRQMHPDLSDQQLEEMYKSMHGTGGSAKSQYYQGMMGNL
ncbi:hypothetical protein [Neobacillus sp. SAB-20_R2A]|uniref:hypothetical protein n=1 Tax=Neobacillus sp. SAB-20_R2A TaxID=3120519 RepID=UPI003C6E735A